MARTQARGGKGGGAGVAVAGHDGLNGRDGRDSRPVPDPTIQTADLVDRATAALRELLEARLAAIDKDVNQLQEDVRTRPAAIVTEIGHLQAVHTERFKSLEGLIESVQTALYEVPAVIRAESEQREKVTDVRFKGVDTQFTERDTRIDQTATTAATAVNAALQAAKEAVREQNTANQLANTKAETGFSEQIKLLGARIEDSKKSQEGTMNDVKDRLTRIESVAAGSIAAISERRSIDSDHRGASGSQVGMIGLGISLIAIVILVFEKVLAR